MPPVETKLALWRLTVQRCISSQIANFRGPTWGPPGSCRPQMGPTLAPETLLPGLLTTVDPFGRTILVSLLPRKGCLWTSCDSTCLWWYNYYPMAIIPDCLVIMLYTFPLLCANSERFLGDEELGFSLRYVRSKSTMRFGSNLVTTGPFLDQTISIWWIRWM